MKRTNGEKIFNVFNIILLLAFACTTVYPFLYTLSISLSSAAEASRAGFHLYPRDISFTAYKMVFKNSSLLMAYYNTIFRTVIGTLLGLLVTCLYGYALARPETPNKKFYTVLLVFTMLFSGGKIPAYLVLKQYHLLNNRWVYILPMLIVPYNVIVSRSFFMSIPNSLNESAKIDGASEFGIFFKIIVPLSKPIIMTLALFMAVAHWIRLADVILPTTAKLSCRCCCSGLSGKAMFR